jgi:hypothetical protein
LLFNLVADMLTLLITQAKEDGQIRGLVPHLVDDGPYILQYADDTILFMKHDLEQAVNMKLLLSAWQLIRCTSGVHAHMHILDPGHPSIIQG